MESIDKIKRLADIVSKNTAPSSNTNTLIGNLLKAMALYMAEQHHGAVGGYQFLNSIDDLPTGDLTDKQKRTGYVIGESIYFYVGTGGDTLDGEYQNGGSFHGTKGDDGLSAYEIWKEIPGNENKTIDNFWAFLTADKGYTKQVLTYTEFQELDPTTVSRSAIYVYPNSANTEYYAVVSNGTIWVLLLRNDGDITDLANSVWELGNETKRINDEQKRIISRKLTISQNGYYDSYGNLNTQNSHAKNTGKISIEGYDKLEYKVSLNNTDTSVAFFDENDNFLSDISIRGTGSGTIDLSDSAYAAAKTVALSYYNANDDFSGFVGILSNSNSLENNIERISENLAGGITLQLSAKGFYNSNGNISTNSHAKNTGKISIEGYDKLEYKVSLNNTDTSVAFFDENDNFLSDISIRGNGSSTIDLSDSAYTNAKTVALSYYNANDDFSGFVGKLHKSSSIGGRITQAEKDLEEVKGVMSDLEKPSKILSLLNNGYYRADGTIANTENAKNTGLVRIDSYDRLDYTVSISSEAPSVAFFNNNGEIITELSILGLGHLFGETVDLSLDEYANVVYIALSYYDSNKLFSGFVGKLYNSDSIGAKTEINSNRIDSIKDVMNNYAASLKNLQLINKGYYNTNGTVLSTNNAMNTGLVSVDGYDRLEYGLNLSNSGFMVAFFDENRNFLSDISILGTGKFVRDTIDLSQSIYLTAKYIALSFYNSNQNFTDFYGLLYSSNSNDIEVENISKLMPLKDGGLDILIFGDSITDCATIEIDEYNRTSEYLLKRRNNSYKNMFGETIYFSMWPYLLTEILQCHDVRNYAKSGASYKWQNRTAGYERQNVLYQIEVAMNDLQNPNGIFPTEEYNPDIVIFALGTNDNTPNDTFESAMAKTITKTVDSATSDTTAFDIDATLANLDKTKFCEAVRFAFLTLKAQFPYALYLCVLPIQRKDRDQGPINAQLRLMAERYGMIVVDGAATAGIVRDFEAPKTSNSYSPGVYLSDGLHPNDQGQKLMARMIVNAIKNYYINLD